MTAMLDNHMSISITDDDGCMMLDRQDSLRFSQSHFLYHHKTDEPIDAHYIIGELLGEGGFGVVYKGTHKKTGAQRAIKKMEKHPRDEELNQQIVQEFEFLKELDHPNLIKVYDMYEDKPNFHIVTDLYGGGDLIDLLEEAVHFSEGQVQLFMNKLLSCIEYLHDTRHMVHRDLKLENILLDTDHNLADIKLIDFGLARHFKTPQETFEELVGSTAYVAPQVIEGTYTAKCDIWSCGVIAFCMLSGYTPFDGYNDGQTLQAILVGRFDFNDPVWEPVSAEAKDFVCNLLAYEEAERPTAHQALAHPWLQNYRHNELDESGKDLDVSLRESIRGLTRFTSKGCKLKQAACALVASQLLQKEEKEALNVDFRFLNRSMGGNITREDLQQALYDLNMDDSDDAVDEIMEQVNFSGSGSISYSEFTIAMMFERDIVKEDKLRLVFDLLDDDGDNHISVQDLQQTLHIQEESCSKMLKPLNLNAHGMLTFDQFCHAILSNESLDGSNINFMNSLMGESFSPARRRLGTSMSELPDTVFEEEGIPDDSTHTISHPTAEKKIEPTPVKPAAVEAVPVKELPVEQKVPERIAEPKQPPETTRVELTEEQKVPESLAEPEKPAEQKEQSKPEGMDVERKRLCFMWYMRFGHPDKQTMLRRVVKMSDICPLTVEDVEAMPWACGGAIIPVKEINAANQTNVTKSGDIVTRRSSVRHLDALQAAELAAAVMEGETPEPDVDTTPTTGSKVDEIPVDATSAVPELKPEETIEAVEVSEPTLAEKKTEPAKRWQLKKVEAKPFFPKPSEIKLEQSAFPKPSEVKRANKGAVFNRPARTSSNKTPLKPSSVLAGGTTSILTTETKIDAEHSESGKTETIVRTRHALPRKENTIFAAQKKGPEVDWKALKETTLKVASVEERKNIKVDFEWTSIVKEEEEKAMGDSMPDWQLDRTRPRDRMSCSETGVSTRRAGSMIWTPSAKSDESQRMKFPKNERRLSAMPGSSKGRRQSKRGVSPPKKK